MKSSVRILTAVVFFLSFTVCMLVLPFVYVGGEAAYAAERILKGQVLYDDVLPYMRSLLLPPCVCVFANWISQFADSQAGWSCVLGSLCTDDICCRKEHL